MFFLCINVFYKFKIISANDMSWAIKYPRISPVFTMMITIIAVVVNAMTYLGPKHSRSQFNALQMSKTVRAIPRGLMRELFQPGLGHKVSKARSRTDSLPSSWSTGGLRSLEGHTHGGYNMSQTSPREAISYKADNIVDTKSASLHHLHLYHPFQWDKILTDHLLRECQGQ